MCYNYPIGRVAELVYAYVSETYGVSPWRFESSHAHCIYMSNRDAWEREYQDPKLMALAERPTQGVLDFLRWLKKEQKTVIDGWRVLDLGSGTGRNANFLAHEKDCRVSALELSANALQIATTRAKELGVVVDYRHHDIGQPYSYPNDEFDLALDVTSSNSLDEKGREVYLKEVQRVLKPGGWFFVRALCKDGDKNAQNLLKNSPGPEKDTYIMPDLGLIERVFSREDFVALYSPCFKIVELAKDTHYAKFNNQSYKRNYWVAYLQK